MLIAEYYFMIFIVYSFVGWLWETAFCSFKSKHFDYRGFLLGPYCPVYGVGISLVLLLVSNHQAGNLINLFFNAVVIVTVTEYFSSWLLERFFHMQLWDYSHYPLNLNGRIDVIVSLFFGLGCVFLIKVIQPIFNRLIVAFIQVSNHWGVIILFGIFILDAISTLVFSFTTKIEVEKLVDTSDENNAAVKEYRLKHLFKNHESAFSRDKLLIYLQNNHKKWRYHSLWRIIKNYPNFKIRLRK